MDEFSKDWVGLPERNIKNELSHRKRKKIKIKKNVVLRNPPKENKLQSSLITNTDKKTVSVIVTAFNTQDYIDECLDSIKNQTYFKNNNYEILVAVDNHLETLEKLKGIKHRYDNLRVFNSEKNVGTYILRNSLSEFCVGDYILFFDSDDVLKENAVEKIINTNSSYVRFFFEELGNCKLSGYEAHGAFWISRTLFKSLGGFQPWICGADSELHKRLNKNNILHKTIREPLFFRRIHGNNLTNASLVTGVKSKLRNSYVRWVKVNTNWNMFVSPIRIELFELEQKNIDLFIASMPDRNDLIEILENIIPQKNLNKIFLVLNNFDEARIKRVRDFLDSFCFKYNVKYDIFIRKNEKGSSEKFYPLRYAESKYIAFIDDDIIYPTNYLQTMVMNCNKLGGVVSMHGRVLLDEEITNYYKQKKNLFAFKKEVLKDEEVDIIGTGCMLFRKDFFKAEDLNNFYENIEYRNMDDIYFSYFALENDIKRFVVKHKEGYLKAILNDNCVFNNHKDNCVNQTNFINEKFLPKKKNREGIYV